MRRLALIVELGRIASRRQKQKTVQPLKVAVDLLARRNAFDAIDGGCMAAVELAGALGAAPPGQFGKAIVTGRCQMRRGACRHAAADLAAIEHDDIASVLSQFKSGGEAGDAAAD